MAWEVWLTGHLDGRDYFRLKFDVLDGLLCALRIQAAFWVDQGRVLNGIYRRILGGLVLVVCGPLVLLVGLMVSFVMGEVP